ncbi:MAG: ABC transporter substrate-binding protein, partial [Alphaproteobacteria bacterium]
MEGEARSPLDVELVELEVAEGADDRVDAPRQEGGREREVHVHQLDVAQELGYFRDAGLAVEFVAPAYPNDPPKLVAAGRGDHAISYPPALTLHAERGLPLARHATQVAT